MTDKKKILKTRSARSDLGFSSLHPVFLEKYPNAKAYFVGYKKDGSPKFVTDNELHDNLDMIGDIENEFKKGLKDEEE